MKKLLLSGFISTMLLMCGAAGGQEKSRENDADNSHPVEVVVRRLRKMMPWLKAKEPPKA